MKKFLIITLFVIIDIFIVFLVLFLLGHFKSPKTNINEAPNIVFNIVNATDDPLHIQLKMASNILEYYLISSSHRILKLTQEFSDTCEILYYQGENELKLYKFFLDDTPTSYYIIIKDNEFVFEKIPSLD